MGQYPWYEELDTRERAQVDHARSYAKTHSSAGVPGHSQHILIAKLAGLLDKAGVLTSFEGEPISLDEAR